MLAGAALVPDTALLVPGAAGRGDVLGAERTAASAAVAALVARGPDRVVAVVPAGPPQGRRVDAVRPSLAAAGVDPALLGPTAPLAAPTPGGYRATPAAVALHLLHDAGWDRAVEMVAAGGSDAAALARFGAEVVAAPGRTAVLLVGSLSARRGPDGPLPTDRRAAAFEDAVVADLLDAGPDALARLARVPAALAADLAVSAWGPWQVLVGMSPRGPGALLHRAAPLGAGYAVLTWDVPDGGAP
ncbi:hypothetical protein [Actinotalea sp. JY-7876]|uniref:hypothetical protein n=2 Tax=unclassified Actinotalea TaxID=2638618 RepID=UPI0015F69620|nr:hypothetical protein [Actinotalea sp. JY-7876]